jgi:hypothetical protein
MNWRRISLFSLIVSLLVWVGAHLISDPWIKTAWLHAVEYALVLIVLTICGTAFLLGRVKTTKGEESAFCARPYFDGMLISGVVFGMMFIFYPAPMMISFDPDGLARDIIMTTVMMACLSVILLSTGRIILSGTRQNQIIAGIIAAPVGLLLLYILLYVFFRVISSINK